MKIYYSSIGKYPATEQSFKVTIDLKSEINLLLFIHLLIFILYHVSKWAGLLELPLGDKTVTDYLISCLTISSRKGDFQSYWWISIFTYQFIHFSIGEFLLSTSMLWLFGNILKMKLGERKVILLYIVCIVLSAIAFIISHLVFPIFSAPNGIMEGTFGGVLGIMTTTIIFYKSYQLRIASKILLPVWQIYVMALFLSLAFFYKHNMAYILVYISTIYLGYWYADHLLESEDLKEKRRISDAGS